MAYDPATGNMVLFGGGGSKAAYLGDTWTWSGTAWTKMTPASSATARYGASMDYDPLAGTMVLFGGSGGAAYLSDTWTWSGSTWSKLTASKTPEGRYSASMAFDTGTEDMVLSGGAGTTFSYADTWSLVVAHVPSKPATPTAVAGNAKATVTWTAHNWGQPDHRLHR